MLSVYAFFGILVGAMLITMAACIAGADNFGSGLLSGLILGLIVAAIVAKCIWKSWTIDPDANEVWYTKDDNTGKIRFFVTGVNFKWPWEKRVTKDSHKGVILLNRMLVEEDKANELYTCLMDNAILLFDWQFNFWPNVIKKDGTLDEDNCLAFIKTDMAAKTFDLRGVVKQYLTNLTTVANSTMIRLNTVLISEQIANVFLPAGQICDVEGNHGVMVGTPLFMGAMDRPQIQDVRGNVQASLLLQEIAKNMGKPFTLQPDGSRLYTVDDMVLVAAKVIPWKVVDIRTAPGVKSIMLPGATGN